MDNKRTSIQSNECKHMTNIGEISLITITLHFNTSFPPFKTFFDLLTIIYDKYVI